MPSLLYIADPMCPWSYGFGPQLAALLQSLPELPLEVMVGGLRVYQPEALSDEQRLAMQEDWRKVQAATGLPFVDDLLSQPDFIYDTEPACRAVVLARQMAPTAGFAVLQALQHGFFAEGRDITRGDVVAEIAAAALSATGCATAPDAFHTAWREPAALAAAHDDFTQINRWGISGFPTLILERKRELELVTSGLVDLPLLVEKLQAIVDRQDMTTAG